MPTLQMLIHKSISPLFRWVNRTGLGKCGFKSVKISSGETFRCFGIRQKISCGYAVAITIAILGTASGLLIEKYFKAQTKEQMLRVYQQAYMVKYLQDAVLHVKDSQQELFFAVSQPQKYANRSEQILEDINEVNLKMYQLHGTISSPGMRKEKTTKLDEEIENLLRKYAIVVENYNRELSNLLGVNYPYFLSADTEEKARESLRELINSEIGKNFSNFTEDLSQLSKKLYERQEKEFIEYQEAEKLGNIILITTLLLSALMSAAMAMYTSCAIARPIVFTTAVAQRVTETGNFKLIAPVTTNDEVGQLATSLNQLIGKVAAYTEELQQTQTQLIHTEKMSSLGQMVAGIAHEINNPVNFIYGNIDYVESYLEDLIYLVKIYQEKYPNLSNEVEENINEVDINFIATDFPKIVNSMKNGAQRIREMVISLRNFSRLDEAEIKKVNLHQGIDNTLLIVNNRVKEKIDIVKKYGELPLIECYPAQLNQVFLNIINNAIDALLSCEDLSNKQITIETEQHCPEGVMIKIGDNGCGIPMDIYNKIFNPFFTTKPVGKGTGMGLSISYKIIEKHGGKMEFCSQIGSGTEFRIYLPIERTVSPVVLAA